MIEALLTFNITSCGIRIESHQAYPDCTPSSHLTLILQGTIKSLSQTLSLNASLLFSMKFADSLSKIKASSVKQSGRVRARIMKFLSNRESVASGYHQYTIVILDDHRIIIICCKNNLRKCSFSTRYIGEDDKY